jgi:hypothetical protein
MSRDITVVEAMGLEPTNLLTASQALYQLSYAPRGEEAGYHRVVRSSPLVKASDSRRRSGPGLLGWHHRETLGRRPVDRELLYGVVMGCGGTATAALWM